MGLIANLRKAKEKYYAKLNYKRTMLKLGGMFLFVVFR